MADRPPIGAKLPGLASREVLGGLRGRIGPGLLFLGTFVLPAHIQGRSLGGPRPSMVEEETKSRGRVRGATETSSFQAPGFHEPHRHEGFARAGHALPDHARTGSARAWTGLRFRHPPETDTAPIAPISCTCPMCSSGSMAPVRSAGARSR